MVPTRDLVTGSLFKPRAWPPFHSAPSVCRACIHRTQEGAVHSAWVAGEDIPPKPGAAGKNRPSLGRGGEVRRAGQIDSLKESSPPYVPCGDLLELGASPASS